MAIRCHHCCPLMWEGLEGKLGEGLEDNLPVPTTIPMKEIPKLIDQAKDVQRIMEQRMERMEMSLGAPAE